MQNTKSKKERTKFALVAFMLSAALPVAGNANFDAETQTASKVSEEDTIAMGETYRSGGMGSPAEAMEGSSSSYQGTTTGPGPNGGYPGTPRGSYDTNERAMNR